MRRAGEGKPPPQNLRAKGIAHEDAPDPNGVYHLAEGLWNGAPFWTHEDHPNVQLSRSSGMWSVMHLELSQQSSWTQSKHTGDAPPLPLGLQWMEFTPEAREVINDDICIEELHAPSGPSTELRCDDDEEAPVPGEVSETHNEIQLIIERIKGTFPATSLDAKGYELSGFDNSLLALREQRLHLFAFAWDALRAIDAKIREVEHASSANAIDLRDMRDNVCTMLTKALARVKKRIIEGPSEQLKLSRELSLQPAEEDDADDWCTYTTLRTNMTLPKVLVELKKRDDRGGSITLFDLIRLNYHLSDYKGINDRTKLRKGTKIFLPSEDIERLLRKHIESAWTFPPAPWMKASSKPRL